MPEMTVAKLISVLARCDQDAVITVGDKPVSFFSIEQRHPSRDMDIQDPGYQYDRPKMRMRDRRIPSTVNIALTLVGD